MPSGCLLSILSLLGIGSKRGNRPAADATYAAKHYLFSRAEASFYGVLRAAVGSEYLIFAKIRLADLIYVPGKQANRQSAFNRIQAKHVDFILCHADGVRPCLAIELNDASHDAPHRAARDEFVARVLAQSGLPLLQIKAARTYHVNDIKL
ncbi:MAG TPA: DUF2726 domain-containing protein, partial [Tepidisphaeraceae bacterium]